MGVKPVSDEANTWSFVRAERPGKGDGHQGCVYDEPAQTTIT
ncbi:hypothetical protein [Planctobacterium marinum]|nr:hypothetical protein [Planctobacterium marinum]